MRKKLLNPEAVETEEDRFLEAKTIFENDVVVVAKMYFCRSIERKLSYYYTIGVGEKDSMGDVYSFQTITSRQMVCTE